MKIEKLIIPFVLGSLWWLYAWYFGFFQTVIETIVIIAIVVLYFKIKEGSRM